MDYWRMLREKVGHEQLILSGVAGAIIKDNKILLVKHGAFKKWQIPGGLQELNESIEDAVKREIKEELNLSLEVDKLISLYSSPKWILTLPNGDKIQQLTSFLLMKGYIDESIIRLQEEEITLYNFFDFDNIPEDTMECCKEKIKDVINYVGNVFLK